MKLWFSLLFPLILVSCSFYSDRDHQTIPLYVDLAKAQLAKNQPQMALATLKKAEAIDPHNRNVLHQMGLTYFVFKRYDLASDCFGKAVSIDSSFSEGRTNYARALIELGRFAEAREQLEVVINDLTYPNPALANSNYGLAYYREGKPRDAIPYLQKAIKLNRNNCLSYSTYGRSLYDLKDFRGAIPVFDVAVNLCKKVNFDEAHYFAALTYFKSGDKTKGVALMNETILLYPDGEYQDKAKSMLELMKLNKI